MITKSQAVFKLRSRLARLKDAASIIGESMASDLEKADVEILGLEVKVDGEPDPAVPGHALIFKADNEVDDYSGGFDDEGILEFDDDLDAFADWSANSDHGFKKIGANGRRVDIWHSAFGGVQLRLQDREGKRFTASDGPLGLLTMPDAKDIADRFLAGESKGFIELEASSSIFKSRLLAAGATPEQVEQQIRGEKNMLPTNSNPISVKDLARATTIGAVQPAPAPAPAPVERAAPRSIQPGAITPDVLNQIIQNAVAPLRQELADLRMRNRAAPAARGTSRPRPSMEVRSFKTGTDRHYGQVQEGLSVKSIARASVGLVDSAPPAPGKVGPRDIVRADALRARSYNHEQAEMSKAARFKNYINNRGKTKIGHQSKVMPEMRFPTVEARDTYDKSFDQPYGVPSVGG